VPVRGLAAPTVQAFATPLGSVPLDQAALDMLDALPQVERSDLAHAFEHALEVQLPFLQQVLGEGFRLVPLAVGDATPDEVAEVLERRAALA
jgi:AmmeMemoRadiSam system protein B